MFILWMPYIRFTDGRYRAPGADQSIRVGQALLWPDDDSVWQNHVGVARPSWLNAYREFPRHGGEQVGPPCRGTVVTSNHQEWLKENYRRLIAVLYFVGDRACFEDSPRQGWPAECFYGHQLSIGEQTHDLVEIWTKHGSKIEDEDSLKLTPTLPVRGHHGPYLLDLRRPEHLALIRLLTSNAQHRLITACLHYFLAQLGDPLVVSFEQDYANYCASLEAAFGIVQGDSASQAATAQPPSNTASPPPSKSVFRRIGNLVAQGLGRFCMAVGWRLPASRCAVRRRDSGSLGIYEQLESHVISVYGDTPELRDYVRGLYSCRSIHDHGLSDFDTDEVQSARHRAYRQFRSKRGNYSICRAICRDIILRQLWEQPGIGKTAEELLCAYTDGASGLLRKFFCSSRTWQDMKRRARATRSGMTMATLTGTDLEGFRQQVTDLVVRFSWQCVQPQPNANTVRTVLRALLDAHARSASQMASVNGSPDMTSLVTAFRHPTDSNGEIAIWATEHAASTFNVHSGNRTDLLTAAAWRMATFFA